MHLPCTCHAHATFCAQRDHLAVSYPTKLSCRGIAHQQHCASMAVSSCAVEPCMPADSTQAIFMASEALCVTCSASRLGCEHAGMQVSCGGHQGVEPRRGGGPQRGIPIECQKKGEWRQPQGRTASRRGARQRQEQGRAVSARATVETAASGPDVHIPLRPPARWRAAGTHALTPSPCFWFCRQKQGENPEPSNSRMSSCLG